MSFKNKLHKNLPIMKYYLLLALITSLVVAEKDCDCDVCAGNSADFCHSSWLPYPNLNAALSGVDRPSLNPVPNDKISNPGIKSQIFKATFKDETGRFSQYDFVQTIDDLRCSSKFEEDIYSTFEDLIDGWSSYEESGFGIQTGPEIDITVGKPDVGSASFTIPPMFTRSESESHEAQTMEEHFNSEFGSVAHSRAECSIYRVIVNIHNPDLKFHSGFEAALLKIDGIARTGTIQEKRNEAIKFINNYGTHYSANSQMGSSIAFETRYTKNETEDNSKEVLKDCSTISGLRYFGMQVEDDTSECTDSLEDTRKGSDTTVKRTIQSTVGSYPAGSKGISDWSKQLQDMAKEGKLTPSPIRRKMDPIVNLFETEAVRVLTHQSGPYEGEKVNVTNLKEVMYRAYNEYCSLKGVNCHLGCPMDIVLTYFETKSHFVRKNFPYNERVVYCDQTRYKDCLFFASGRWNLGREIGKPETSSIQTSDCPQFGGEFVDMVPTKNSPLYGVKTWTDCASICENQPGCNHWMFNENQECHSVISFKEFQSNENVVAGERNCPLSSQNLFTMCPTRGSNVNMWRPTTPENNAFYDPKIKLSYPCPTTTNSNTLDRFESFWIQLENEQCYLFEASQMEKSDAHEYCVVKGGHLVEITTKEESDLIHNNNQMLGIRGWYWLGLTKTGSSWKWEIAGDADFTHWYSNEPDGSCLYGTPCNCAAYGPLSSMDWYDNCCDTQTQYVLCEANPIKSP